MPNAVWPADLPQSLPLLAPIQPVDRRGRFEPDAGPAQIWSLETEPVEVIPVEQKPMELTSYERGVLVALVRDDLIGGVLPFDWVDPWPGAGLCTFRFLRLPVYLPVVPARDIGGRTKQILYQTTFALEWFPWLPPAQIG